VIAFGLAGELEELGGDEAGAHQQRLQSAFSCANLTGADVCGPLSAIGGQVVAGSNPVSPTREHAVRRLNTVALSDEIQYPPGL
jgi:hypothetical protein